MRVTVFVGTPYDDWTVCCHRDAREKVMHLTAEKRREKKVCNGNIKYDMLLLFFLLFTDESQK